MQVVSPSRALWSLLTLGASLVGCVDLHAPSALLDGGSDGSLDRMGAGEVVDVMSPPAKLARGERCAFHELCETGQCVEGVCCESACAGICATCAAPGIEGLCRPAAPGTDPRNSCSDEGAASCGFNGTCAGDQTCARYAPDTPCLALTCANDQSTRYACNGQGACLPSPAQDCYPYACAAPSGCRVECATNADCVSPAECFSGICGGIVGTYYESPDFTGRSITRVDRQIDFVWLLASPAAPTIPIDGFSIRWRGKVTPRFSEMYTFHVISDDGVRLWIDDVLIIDDFRSRGTTETTGRIALTAGQAVSVRLEHFDDNSEATARLLWSSASVPKQVISVTALTP